MEPQPCAVLPATRSSTDNTCCSFCVSAAPMCVAPGKHLMLKVQKRPGKEAETLLPAADVVTAKKKEYGTINVFTVASGHMYERLQKIMILSVIKNTKSK